MRHGAYALGGTVEAVVQKGSQTNESVAGTAEHNAGVSLHLDTVGLKGLAHGKALSLLVALALFHPVDRCGRDPVIDRPCEYFLGQGVEGGDEVFFFFLSAGRLSLAHLQLDFC